MKNEQMMVKEAHKSLGKSLDELREEVLGLGDDIGELYDLDEDNWKQVQGVKAALESAKKRLDILQLQVRRNRGRMLLGFLCLSGLIYAGYKAIDRLQDKVKALEEEKETKEAKAEESDG